VRDFVNLAQIILSIALTVAVLLQVRGSGLGAVFGGDAGIVKTRRGVEKLLFNITIGLAVAFFIVALINAKISG
jgi:preprotein translocase subunit SecG